MCYGVQMVIFRVIRVEKSGISVVSVWFLEILLSWCYHCIFSFSGIFFLTFVISLFKSFIYSLHTSIYNPVLYLSPFHTVRLSVNEAMIPAANFHPVSRGTLLLYILCW